RHRPDQPDPGGPHRGQAPQTTTHKKGRYELTLRFRDSKWVRVMQVWAWAEGCVRAELHHPIPLKDGERSRLDLTLARGEPLAGVMRLPQAPLEPRPEDRVVYFFVIGPKFRQVHWTEKAGKFKVTVPPGVYTIQTFPPDKF